MECKKAVSESLTANMPEPPAAIEGLLDEYQDFLGSVFAREYQNRGADSCGNLPSYMPRLSREERVQIEQLTKKLHSMPEWRDYVRQFRRFAYN